MRCLVNGCFDLLHAGHVEFLKLAATFGDLTIGLNSDESIAALKGPDRPVWSYFIRAKAIWQIMPRVQIKKFDGDADKLVQEVNPDIIVRGYDQIVGAEDWKHPVVIAPKFGDISTTKILGTLLTP